MGLALRALRALLVALSSTALATGAAFAQPDSACERKEPLAISEDRVERWIESYEAFTELADELAVDHAVSTTNGLPAILRQLASTEARSTLDEAATDEGFADLCEWLGTADAVAQAYSILIANPADRDMMMVDATVEQNVNVVRPFESDVRLIIEDR